MESVLIKVAAFLVIIFGGYALKRIGFFRADDFRLISTVVLKITLPCAVISNFGRIEVEVALYSLVLLGVILNLVTIGAGFLASRRNGPDEQAFSMINYSGYNIGCFTLPYIQTFLGPVGVVATCLFDAGNSLMCTGATYSMAAAVKGKDEGDGVMLFLKRMFSSIAMDTYILMVVLSVIGFAMPKAVLTFTDIVGAANPFLAMLMIGVGFELQLERRTLVTIGRVLLSRYLIAAVLAWLLYTFAPFDAEVRKVLAVIAFAPLSAVCAIFTAQCFDDPARVALSCTINSLSIVCSIVFMTALMLAL